MDVCTTSARSCSDHVLDRECENGALGNPVDAADGAQCPKKQLACQEARRVLQPEGFMAIHNMSLDQLKSYWWMKLIPKAAEKYAVHLQEYPALRTTVEKAGFKDIETITIMDKQIFPTSIMYDPEGPLKEEFRKSMSFFSVATEEEIDNMVAHLTEAKQKGMLTELMIDLDKDAVKFGRFYMIFAQ